MPPKTKTAFSVAVSSGWYSVPYKRTLTHFFRSGSCESACGLVAYRASMVENLLPTARDFEKPRISPYCKKCLGKA